MTRRCVKGNSEVKQKEAGTELLVATIVAMPGETEESREEPSTTLCGRCGEENILPYRESNPGRPPLCLVTMLTELYKSKAVMLTTGRYQP